MHSAAPTLTAAESAPIEIWNVSTDLSTILGVVGIVIGVLCAAWGVSTSRKAAIPRQAKLFYRIDSSVLLEMPHEEYFGPAVRGISILYNAKPINDLRRSYIAVWNGGDLELEASKHLEEGSLKMTFRQAVILESRDPLSPQILATAPNDLRSRVTLNTSGPDSLVLSFKYLRPGEGWLCEVIHSGGLSRLQHWRDAPVFWSEVHGDCREPQSRGALRFYSRPNLRRSMEEAFLDQSRTIALAVLGTVLLVIISLVLPNFWTLAAASATAVVAWPSLVGLFHWYTSIPGAEAREMPEPLLCWPDQPGPPSPLLGALHEYFAPRLAAARRRSASTESESRPDRPT